MIVEALVIDARSTGESGGWQSPSLARDGAEKKHPVT